MPCVASISRIYAFFNKVKVRPFNIFSKNLKIQQAFTSLTNPNDIFDEKKIEVVHEFTCLMYGIKNCQCVNVATFLLFNKMYATTRNNERFMKNIKGFDSTHIPPCWKSFKQKLLRTIFVNSMWQNATDCIKFSAENCDWILDGFLKPTWFVGDLTPMQVQDVLCDPINECSENADDGSDICSYENESFHEAEVE